MKILLSELRRKNEERMKLLLCSEAGRHGDRFKQSLPARPTDGLLIILKGTKE